MRHLRIERVLVPSLFSCPIDAVRGAGFMGVFVR